MFNAMVHFFVAVLVVLVLIFSFQLIAGAGRRRRHLPPGPWPFPIVGSFPAVAFSSRPHRALARLAERYGPLMTIWNGPFPAVVVSTPAAAREVLARPNADLAGRTVLDAWRAEGHAARSVLFLPPGGRWRAMRRFATSELFAQRRLDARRPLREEKARELAGHVAARAARGELVDVGEAAFAVSMDMMSRTMFSVDLGHRRGLRRVMKTAVELSATPTVSDLFPVVAAADVQGVRRRTGAQLRAVYRIIDEQFSRRRRGRDAGEPRKDDLMDVAIDKEHEWEEEGSNEMSYDAVKGLFADLLFAGTDTVSTAVEWAMAELLQCPEAMNKAREELKTVIGTKTEVEESDIAQLPYLQAVVKEALRLHPPISLTNYRAMATVQVGGYTIPRGTNILLNIWAIHRNADVWTDPDKFIPERFIGKDISFWGKNFELIPFGAGRRLCIGLPLAYRTVHLMLGSLLYHFDWTLPEEAKEKGIDMSEKLGVVVSMATPLKAVAKKCV